MKFLRSASLLAAAFVCTGLLSTASAATRVIAPLPTVKPGSQAVLLGVDSVRKELHLTSLQKAILNDLRTEYRDEARAIVAKAGTTVESKKAAQASLEALTSSTNRRALRALNDDQRARLAQIEHHILGAFMLLDGKVQNELGLTAKQRAKLAYVWFRTKKTASAINKRYEEGKISYPQRILELRDNRIDRSDDMLERLTKEQRAKLDQLAGPNFAAI
jgi:Spy/CpxP family protein refolding chaperone